MLDDTLTRVSWRARPRSFVALMSLYESNFIRLGWLAGDLARLEGRHCSHVAGDCDLLLTVTGRSPYTTTADLTYVLPGGAGAMAYPDMRLCIYHDAHLLEAQEWAAGQGLGQGVGQAQPALRPPRSAPETPRKAERELDQRWARNMMLNKWLEYCAERGHRFSTATRLNAAE
ncbi:MAG TPA: DUF1249 domain-containing protein [Steroidobacteraceae bacterium]|nr:DUF1249 domain-containing protein [Steroidobacteraceae bacterium]